MGKRKSNELHQTPQNDTVSPPPGIFNSLFGNAPAESVVTAASLFSDDNPFRRKPQQPALVSDATNRTQGPNNDFFENHDTGGEKKRKKKKEKSPNLDSDSKIEALEKKRKHCSHEKGGERKDLDLGLEDEEGKQKKEKKRKRDELEKEWEEKKYGKVEGGEEGEKEGVGNIIVGSKRKVLENPADLLVSKEGFDDEDKLLRTIFVGNLPLNVKKKTLLKEFKKFGEVESVRIRSVPIQDTKKPRKGAILAKKINDSGDSVHAYVVFKTEESAQASLSHNMNVVEGNHIRVDRACPPRKKLKGESAALYDNKRTVFVGNLPFDVKDEELYQLFCGMSDLKSSIEAVRVVRDPHLNVGKGIAYVLFKTREAANYAVKKRNLKLRDRELRLSYAKANATPSKRPNSSPAKASSTPAKKLAVGSKSPLGSYNSSYGKIMGSKSPSSSYNSSNRKINTSYQGLRATKSDIPKKFNGGEKSKERKTKRPSVAARKAKAKTIKEGGTPKQAGFKRKLDSRTPDSSLRNNKGKKMR